MTLTSVTATADPIRTGSGGSAWLQATPVEGPGMRSLRLATKGDPMILYDSTLLTLAEALAVVRQLFDVPAGEPVASSERL